MSRIIRVLGVPMVANENTTQQARISYARVLVERDVTKPIRYSRTLMALNLNKKFIMIGFLPSVKHANKLITIV